MFFPRPYLFAALFGVCGGLLLAPAAGAQSTLPQPVSPTSSSAAGPGTPSDSPAASSTPMSAPPGSDAATSSPSTTANPPVASAGPGGLPAAPGLGAYAPVSPAVPLVSSPLPSLGSAPTPPPGQGTLPAAPPAALSASTPGAASLPLTADEAARLAVRGNLGLRAALRDAFAAGSGVQSARALAPPSFTIGPAFKTGGTTDGLLFLQPLELNGTRGARAGVARAQLRLAQAQALLGLQALVYTARLYYYALARAQANVALQQNLLLSAQQFDRIARTQVKLGARPGIEAIQTAIEVARARQLAAQSRGEEQAARAALNAYLGRAPLDPIGTARGLTPSAAPTVALSIADAQRLALDGRAEVAVARAYRDVPGAQESLYRAQGRPDLSPSFRISQITPTYMDAGVGVVISVPIDYGTRRGLIRQSRQQAEAQEARLTGAQAQVRLDAEQAVVRLQAAQAVLTEYDAGLLASAHAVLLSALAGYRAGGTTIISVLEAQRTYRQILSDRLEAQTSVAEAQAALDRAIGSVPPSLLAALYQELQTSPSIRNQGGK